MDLPADVSPPASDRSDGCPPVAGAGHRHARRPPRDPRPVPAGRVLTMLAFAIVAVPFAYAVLRLATAPTAHLALPDDLALIDLHVRRALAWKQQLGVFDHNNWNHPGPSYFYLVSVAYRVLGSDVRALFVGATLVNAGAALSCVAVVRRRTSPAVALWAAVWVGALVAVLAAAGPASTTYSESVLGALVSPWNPTVVLFPLLLVLLLCAGAVDRSAPSLVGALLVGTFVIQTDISAGPLVVALLVVAGGTWAVTAALDHRSRAPRTHATPDGSVATVPVRPGGNRTRVLVVGGSALVVLAWVPPLVQQLTNHPGNMTLIARFFGASHAGQGVVASLRAVAAAMAVVAVGPSEVMTSILGGTPAHAAIAVAVTVATVVLAVGVAVVGGRRGDRFALGIGALTAVGWLAAVVAVTHVVGFVFGYLVLWAAVLPVAALVGVGTLRPRLGRAAGALRIALCAVAVGVGVVACVRVAAIPPLSRAGDPHVTALADLVTARIPPGGRVVVGDAGAGTADTQLLDTEEFIGLVNALDRAGYRPTVNAFWKAQFGPGFLTDGTEPRRVGLSTWAPTSPSLPGYVGRVGDMAVTVTDDSGAGVPPAG